MQKNHEKTKKVEESFPFSPSSLPFGLCGLPWRGISGVRKEPQGKLQDHGHVALSHQEDLVIPQTSYPVRTLTHQHIVSMSQLRRRKGLFPVEIYIHTVPSHIAQQSGMPEPRHTLLSASTLGHPAAWRSWRNESSQGHYVDLHGEDKHKLTLRPPIRNKDQKLADTCRTQLTLTDFTNPS